MQEIHTSPFEKMRPTNHGHPLYFLVFTVFLPALDQTFIERNNKKQQTGIDYGSSRDNL
jgi:hypothetical protein